jgi:hypothetical protein
MEPDPNLSPPLPNSGLTRFFKRTGESTTAFFRRLQQSKNGGTSILVGGFIGSASAANDIIERGIRGEPVSVWHGVKFLFFFTLSTCQSYNLWKSDPNSKPPAG